MERRPRVLVYGIQGSCDNYCRALAAAGMEAVVSTEKDAAAEGLLLLAVLPVTRMGVRKWFI